VVARSTFGSRQILLLCPSSSAFSPLRLIAHAHLSARLSVKGGCGCSWRPSMLWGGMTVFVVLMAIMTITIISITIIRTRNSILLFAAQW
jgi:hypothetical protein